MNLYLVLYNRDFSQRSSGGERLRYSVASMSWEAIGGCNQATVDVFGPELDLWALTECLRCPAEIYDAAGRLCWWGYVESAAVRVEAFEVGATIESMSNRVAVSYNEVTPGSAGSGTPTTTAWADNLASQAEYGIRELLDQAGNLSATAATARRTAVLARQGLPAGMAVANPFAAAGGAVGRMATLTLRGWWYTLGWKYASWAAVTGPKYETIGATTLGIGDASARTKLMQGFQVMTASINVLSVDLYIKKVNTPADDLRVEIYKLDTATGAPTGSALSSATITAASVGTSYGWVNANLTDLTVSPYIPDGMYGIMLSRSGAIDAVNYFAIAADGTVSGSTELLFLYNGTSWSVRSPSTEANFRVLVNDDVESSMQIHDLASNYGQFLTEVVVDAASGVDLPSYREGKTTALEEIRALMESGGPSGRRYLAEITPERGLHVWEEPASGETYLMSRQGRIYDLTGTAVAPWCPPVGCWLRLRDVMPAGIDTSLMIDPTLQFLEGVEWTAAGINPRFRGQLTIEEALKIKIG